MYLVFSHYLGALSKLELNLEMLVFEEGEKPEYLEKNLSEQRREPTKKSTHISWVHIGGGKVLSPLNHHCFPKITLGLL